MSRIAIIADTDCSLPTNLAEQHGIRQVPIAIHFGDTTYTTGVDIDDASLFARVDKEGVLPTTAAPTPERFLAAFEEAFAAGADTILCFCVSSGVSATYHCARLAADMLPGRDVRVIDTRTISMGFGFQAIAAARAIAAGASADEALSAAAGVAQRVQLFATVPTTKYLAMGGRIGPLASVLAGLLDVKPMLTVADGKLGLLERVRSQNKARKRLLELAQEGLNGRPCAQLAILHVNAAEAAKSLAAEAEALLHNGEPAAIAELTPGLSVHGGPGMLGIVAVAAG
jgi:DegV family protein with EDD domain